MDALLLWGFEVTGQVTEVDYGTVPQRSSADFRFRVKNNSGVYIAQAVTLSVEGTGSDQLSLSTDGARFSGTVTVGDLAPMGLSLVLYLRRNTPSTATTGGYTCNLRAHPSSWTPAHT